MLSIDEVNELENKYNATVKQYNSLLKKHKEMLNLAKENADANEYCLQELECKIEAITRENDRLKEEVLNLRGYNIKYELALKEIREAAMTNLNAGIIISTGWLEQKIDEVLDD